MTFSEYYKYYLTLHTHPKCRLLHFIGQWMTLLFIYLIVSNGFWLLIPLTPFIVYPFAWSGHYFLRKINQLHSLTLGKQKLLIGSCSKIFY